jgi:hypothetical protein
MSDSRKQTAAEKFRSPSALRQFALETATLLRQTGLSEAGSFMEVAANFPATTGWEWLAELGQAAKAIGERFELPQDLRARVSLIARTATSRQPYG